MRSIPADIPDRGKTPRRRAKARRIRLAADIDDLAVTIVGHPYAPIGMGEQLRSHVAACRAVGLNATVHDVYRFAQRLDPAHRALIEPIERDIAPPGVRIFHVNGDEVASVLEAFSARGSDFEAGYNIIVPAWELPTYPAEWAAELRRFDEVWALSSFIRDSLAASGIESRLIGQSVQMPAGPLLPRRHFGIRESAFVLLHLFDLSSYTKRKNPDAVLTLLDRLRDEDPFADIQLVLKVKDRDQDASAWAAALPQDPRLKVIATPLDSLHARGLIRACDCFVSLHRAEGFGRGLGEAMMLGRLALATGWSGNLDFMTEDNALLARHRLIPVEVDAYPHWRGQHWAEADLDHAVELLAPVMRDPTRGRARALRGQADVFRTHGNRAVGTRILRRLREILLVA